MCYVKKLFSGILFALVIFTGLRPASAAAAGTVLFETHSTEVDSGFWGRGNGGGVDKIAQKYIPSSDQTICAVEHQIARFSSATDSVVLSVYTGGGSPEAGRVVASSTLPAATIPLSTGTHTSFPLAPCLSIQGGTTYWFTFTRTSLNGGNGYISAYRPSNEYGYSSHWQFNGFDPQGWQENLSREWSLRLIGPEPKRNEPIVIVPGIMQTKLNRVSDGAEVWPNIEKMKSSSTDAYLDDLILPANGSASILAGDIIRTTTTTILGLPYERSYLQNLISSLAEKGYTERTDLFVVPYDWRLDLADSVARLDAVVQTARANSPTGKVTIIAHSLGGLLTKEYVRSAGSSGLINKLILVGAPNLGAPKAAKILNYGDNMNIAFSSLDILNPQEIKKITQHMPAVYELLPSQKYLQAAGPYLADYRSGAQGAGMSFAATTQFLKSAGRDPALVDRSASFHSSTDDLTLLASSTYLLAGCKQSNTIGGISLYDNSQFRLGIVAGDGTVPLLSANALASSTRRYFIDANHVGLVRDQVGISVINNILTGELDVPVAGASQEISSCNDGHNTLLFSSHSPVDLHVYDSQNRHTGPTASGDIELGIPNSDYQKLEDNTFIFVPGGETYRVVAQATAAGTATIDASLYVGPALTAKVSYLSIPLSSGQTTAQVTIGDVTTAPPLQLDTQGDGIIDVVVAPIIAGTVAAAADTQPPVITISSPQSTTYSRSSQLPVQISISEADSGVATSSILLDGLPQTASTTLDLFFMKLGQHVLKVSAYDNAGNFSATEREFTIAADAASTISDLGRALSLGWIAKKTTALDVVGDLTAALTAPQRGQAMTVLTESCSQQRLSTRAYLLLKEDFDWLTAH